MIQQNIGKSTRISKISRTESANHNPRELPTSTIKSNHPYPKIAVLFILALKTSLSFSICYLEF